MIFTFMRCQGFFRKSFFINTNATNEETIQHLYQDLLPSMGVATKDNNSLKLVSTNSSLNLTCEVTPYKKGSIIDLKGQWLAQSYMMYGELILLMIGLSTVPKRNLPFMSWEYFLNSAVSALPVFLILTVISFCVFYVMKKNEKSINTYLCSSLAAMEYKQTKQ